MTAPTAATADPRPLVLVVDDQPENLYLLGEILDARYRLRLAKNGEQALALLRQAPLPELVLLDVMMPGMDGFEVLRQMQADRTTAALPVIFVTARDGGADEEAGLRLGAVDYVTKPFMPEVLLARVATHLELKRARDQLARRNAALESEVRRRTRELLLVKDVSIAALAALGETRDLETGQHIRRTQLYIQRLGDELLAHPERYPGWRGRLDALLLRTIVEAAPLHDIGKIGIPDRILLKPGRLDADEFAIMKTHAALGRDTLDRALREAGGGTAPAPGGALDFLIVARDIAGGHHERWDGSGYPIGLAGADIPPGARLMALADVFDALISRRVYKAAMPMDEVVAIILQGRGGHFDPELVDAFLACRGDFEAIAREHADPD